MPKSLMLILIPLLFLMIGLGLLRISKVPKVSGNSVTEVHLKRLADACKNFKHATGAWPTNLTQLRLYVPTTAQDMFRDEWGHDFVLSYRTNAPGSIWLECYGADGAPGGNGSNADSSIELQ
jgi:hypothetical protein